MNIVNYTIDSELLGARNILNKNHSAKSKNLANTATTAASTATATTSFRYDFKQLANADNFTRKLPYILKEREYDLTETKVNKIFCAQWLDDRRVLMGTKCNKFVLLDTITGKYSIQNPLKSHRNSINIENHSGLHSISINPSRTLLATGAEHVNDIAVYSLPDLEPVSVGYGAHSYWIFDAIWLDDQHVCSGSGDNRLALWKIETDKINPSSNIKSKVLCNESSKLSSNRIGSSFITSSSSLSSSNPTSSMSNKQHRHYNNTFSLNYKTTATTNRSSGLKRHLASSNPLSFTSNSYFNNYISPSPLPSSSSLANNYTPSYYFPFTTNNSSTSSSSSYSSASSSYNQTNSSSYYRCNRFNNNYNQRLNLAYNLNMNNDSRTPNFTPNTTHHNSAGNNNNINYYRNFYSRNYQYSTPSPSYNHNNSNNYQTDSTTSFIYTLENNIDNQQQQQQQQQHRQSSSNRNYFNVYDYNHHTNNQSTIDEENESQYDAINSETGLFDENNLETINETSQTSLNQSHNDFRLINGDDHLSNELISYDENVIDIDEETSSQDQDDLPQLAPSRNDDDDDDEHENDEYNTDQQDLNEYDNNNNNDDNDNDDDDDNECASFKRRRLNSVGKFQLSNGIRYQKPTKIVKCKQSKRIRALAFNPKRNEIAAISMNAAFHYFDIKRFEQKYTKKLSPFKENVCLTINNDYTIYAIGSASHVQLLDSNNARQLVQPVFVKKDIGIRSLNFRNNILSIGTGIGTVLFYDLRAHKFLNDFEQDFSRGQFKLQTSGGWILRNDTYYDSLTYGFNTENTHAIYSHSYDPSGTKLLTAGGPLTVNLFGHYAGVWR